MSNETPRFLIVEDASQIVRFVSVGHAQRDGHTTYPMPADVDVSVDWVRLDDGSFAPPPTLPEPPPPPEPMRNEIEDLARRVTAIDSKEPMT